MPWSSFIVILILTAGCTFLARTLPVLLFARKQLPETVNAVLGYIPIAAFAALVMNDLFRPELFDQGLWTVLMPWLALIPVIIVARTTRSLGLCIVVGVAALWGLTLI